MPVNAGYEFAQAQKKFIESRTDEEKIAALEEMLSSAPTHKGAEGLRDELKQKLSKLKKRQEALKAKKSKRSSVFIKKEGAARVVLIGLPNSGKSYVLSRITNAKPAIADYEFTTKKPEVGIMLYEGVKIQVIEVPALFKGFYNSNNGPMYMSFIREADLIVIVLDGVRDTENDLKVILDELRKGWMKLIDEKFLIIVNKNFKYINTIFKVCSIEKAKEEIWRKLGLIYVFTKSPGKQRDYPPVALKYGSSVKDLAVEIHKDFLSNFGYARIWGKSVKHDGATVGLNHVMQSGDVIEFHMK